MRTDENEEDEMRKKCFSFHFFSLMICSSIGVEREVLIELACSYI